MNIKNICGYRTAAYQTPEQRPEAVQAWLDEHYPAIDAKAKAEGG
jgi:hypothetical protein